jgi:hypothetical protein
MQENFFTTTSYIYVFLTIFFLILTYFVLRKNRNIINISFASTTFIFSLNAVGNIINQSNIKLDEPISMLLTFFIGLTATLGPLGLMTSALIIHKGNDFFRDPIYIVVLVTYLFFETIAWSFELGLLSASIATPNVYLAMQNGFIILPLIFSLVYYIPVLKLIPDQRYKVITMIIGLSFAIIGQSINAIWNYLNNESSLIGLVIVLLGVFVATISFTNFFDRIKVSKETKNLET